MTQPLDGFKRTCEMCGKEIIHTHLSVYKYSITYKGKKHYYCCYSCWLKAKKQMNIKQYRRMK